MRVYILIILSVVSFVFAAPLRAEEPVAATDIRAVESVWKESVVDLKDSVDVLLQKNDELTSGNEALRKEAVGTQDSIKTAKDENASLESEPGRLTKSIDEAVQKTKELQKKLKDAQSELSLLEKKKITLETGLSNLEKKQKPWEAQVEELKTKATSLELDTQLQRSTLDKEAAEKRSQVDSLKEQLTQNQQKQKELDETLMQIQKQVSQEKPKTVSRPSQELKTQLAKAQTDLKKSSREVEALTQKNSEAQKLQQKTVEKISAQQSDLQKRNQQLQEKINKINAQRSSQSPQEASSTSEEAVKLLESLQAERQDLQAKVTDLGGAIAVLKRQNAMTEALLGAQKEVYMKEATESVLKNIPQTKGEAEAMAYAYAAQGLYPQAAACYEQALKLGTFQKDIYFNLGYVYYQMGNLDDAIKSYQNALKVDPKDDEAKRNLLKLRKELSQKKSKAK